MLPAKLKDPSTEYDVGDKVKVKVLDIEKGNRTRLSTKAAEDEPETVAAGAGEGSDD